MRVVPWPKRLRDVKGRRARLRHDVGNGLGTMPRGTLGRVDTVGNGWHLMSFLADPCPGCGFKWHCGRLGKDAIELVEEAPDLANPR